MKSLFSSFVPACLALGLFLVAADADAFCRSTACRTKKGKECPVDENGCVTTGAKLYWNTACVSYAMNKFGTQNQKDQLPEQSRAVIKKTFEAWTDVDCPDGTVAKMAFEEREPVSCRRGEYNPDDPNINVVFFNDTNFKYRGIDGTLAKTSVTYNDKTGEIYDADIEINTSYNEITITDDPAEIEYDLQAIMTHEVGHFIGIAHSPNPSAVMFASYSPGDTAQRTLHPDDVEAVCAIYPSTSTAACNTIPRNGYDPNCPKDTGAICNVTPGAGASYGVGGIFLATALLAMRARRGKRAVDARAARGA